MADPTKKTCQVCKKEVKDNTFSVSGKVCCSQACLDKLKKCMEKDYCEFC